MSTPPTRPAPAGRPTGAVSRQPAPRPALPPTPRRSPASRPPCPAPRQKRVSATLGRVVDTLPRVPTPQRSPAATLRRVAETQGRGANTLRRVSPYPSMPPRGASKGRRGEREGIGIPFCAPFWGIEGALRPSGGWRDTLSCPTPGHWRGGQGKYRVQRSCDAIRAWISAGDLPRAWRMRR